MAEVVRHIELGDGPVTNDMLERMLTMDGPDMLFKVDRKPQKGRTFGREACDALGQMMQGWVMSRLFRALKEDHPGHTKLRVTVKVEVE